MRIVIAVAIILMAPIAAKAESVAEMSYKQNIEALPEIKEYYDYCFKTADICLFEQKSMQRHAGEIDACQLMRGHVKNLNSANNTFRIISLNFNKLNHSGAISEALMTEGNAAVREVTIAQQKCLDESEDAIDMIKRRSR